MEDFLSEINEIAQVVADLQARLRVASAMAKDQPNVARTNIKIAKEVCGKIKKRLDNLVDE